MAPGRTSGTRVQRATRTWVRALIAWSVCFVGVALALELIVLGLDLGEWSVALVAIIGGAIATGAGGAVAIWRLVGGRLGRPGLAGAFVLVAAAWAALGALFMAWLLATFKP